MTITAQARDRNAPPSALLRWCRFNLVGGMGIVVQITVLFLLKSVLHFNYLSATAIAVEAAVVHNFVWHERFTWADRTRCGEMPCAPGAEALSERRSFIAALKRCATQRLKPCAAQKLQRCATSGLSGSRVGRLLRFNLSTGAVSIFGNVALMKVMVDLGRMNYLLGNAIAITVCAGANFVVSETWVYEAGRTG